MQRYGSKKYLTCGEKKAPAIAGRTLLVFARRAVLDANDVALWL